MANTNQTNPNTFGIVGFAVSMHLLRNLTNSKFISSEEVQEIFDDLLTSLETIPLNPHDPALREARVMIEQCAGIALDHRKGF